MEEYIPAIITASVALIAAVGAQFLNNFLTYKRENKKYLREVYEKFISEYFMDVLLYIDVETDPRKGHDIEEQIDINKVINSMMNKMHYADRNLQGVYFDFKTRNHFYDPKGDIKEILGIKICYYFLAYSNFIMKKLKIKFDKGLKFRLNYNLKAYGYWHLLSELYGYENRLTNEDMTALHMTKKFVLEEFSLKKIDSLINHHHKMEKKAKEFLIKVREKNDITKNY
ncbi:hypothetical protein [Bacillus gobiensis]|uniref:hypothetical protein n=1 Tax=Bacillus gobiensis TaxID=1441095 RepID=UPI003D1D337C